MSVASLEAELAELHKTVNELDRLDSWLASLRTKVQSRADRFSGVKVGHAWSGRAATEFEAEMGRTRSKVQSAADETSRAAGVIDREKVLTRARIIVVEAELVAARLWEAAQAAARQAEQ